MIRCRKLNLNDSFTSSLKSSTTTSAMSIALGISVLSACNQSSKAINEPLKPVPETGSVLEKFATPEKLQIDFKIAKAKAEGKVVLVKISAAWCPPCQQLSKLIEGVENNPTSNPELSATLGKYEIVVLEERFFLNGIITDFLPFQIHFFPSILLIDPVSKNSSLTLVETSPAKLNHVLAAFADKKSLMEHDFDQIQQTIATGEKQLFAVDDLIHTLPIAMALEQEKANADKTFTRFVDLINQNKTALAKAGYTEEYLTTALAEAAFTFQRVLVSSGKTSLEDASKVLAEKLLAMRSSASDYYLLAAFSFADPLAAVAREKGIPEAALACPKISQARTEKWSPVLAKINPDAPVAESDALKKANDDLADVEKRMTKSESWTCMALAVRAGQKTLGETTSFVDAEIAKEEDFATSDGAHDLARLLALAGDFSRATDIESHYLVSSHAEKKKSLEDFDTVTEDRKAKLADAVKAADQEKIKKFSTSVQKRQEYRVGMVLILEAFPNSINSLIEAYKSQSVSPFSKVPAQALTNGLKFSE